RRVRRGCPLRVVTDGRRHTHVTVAVRKRMIPSQIEPVKVRHELFLKRADRALVSIGGANTPDRLHRREVVVASESEDAQRVVVADAPRRARLVVPIVELHAGCDRAEDGPRVSVAPGGENGESAVVDRCLYERTRIDDAEVYFAVRCAGRVAHLTCDGRACEPPVARRRGTRIEVDMIDERWVDDTRAGTHVKQQGHPDPVDVVAVVVGWGSADVEVREPADHGDDAWQRLDRAERIAESTRHLANVRRRERRLPDLPSGAMDV